MPNSCFHDMTSLSACLHGTYLELGSEEEDELFRKGEALGVDGAAGTRGRGAVLRTQQEAA